MPIIDIADSETTYVFTDAMTRGKGQFSIDGLELSFMFDELGDKENTKEIAAMIRTISTGHDDLSDAMLVAFGTAVLLKVKQLGNVLDVSPSASPPMEPALARTG